MQQQETHWAPVGGTMCFWKGNGVPWLLGFILLLALSLLGILFVLAIGIIFTKTTRHTRCEIIRGMYGLLRNPLLSFPPLCRLWGFSLENHKASQVKPGRHYLAWAFYSLHRLHSDEESLKILLAFSCDPQLQHVLKCCYKPHPHHFHLQAITWLSFALSSSSLQPLLWDRMSPCPESLSLNVRRVPFLHLTCWAILPSWPSCASFVPSKAGNYLTITMRPNS